MSLKSSFVAHLKKNHSHIADETLNNAVSDNLISAQVINLKQSQIDQIKQDINEYWQLRQWSADHLTEQYLNKGLIVPKNYAACMSYDFHINNEGQPELIEINTNAAFLALGLEMYEFMNLPNSFNPSFNQQSLVEMFKQEMALAKKSNNTISIVDEKPSEQRLYLEFLIYDSLFKKNNLNSEIQDLSDITEKNEFIYNRYTDFYLSEEKSKNLKKLFNSNQTALSPNPYEYFLLADKQRLIDWTAQTDLPHPKSLLKCYDLANEPREKIWAERKQLFFKPKNSFGSKQAYKGASMSTKTFDEAYANGFIAQQLSVPSQVKYNVDGVEQSYKYDIRCYAYKNELQLAVARIYQGQTTNLRTTHGGFACIKVL